jgi:hypothetical protein
VPSYVFFIGHADQAQRGYINYFWPHEYCARHIDYFLAGRLLQLCPPHQLFLIA